MTNPPIEARKQSRISRDRHTARLPGAQFDPLEPEQAHSLLARRLGQVELGHIGTLAFASVGDSEARGDRVAAFDFEVTVVEARVAEAMAEGVERLLVFFREPAVADLGTSLYWIVVGVPTVCRGPRAPAAGSGRDSLGR